MCLPHLSSIFFKEVSPKTCGPNCVYICDNISALLRQFVKKCATNSNTQRLVGN